jgi:hypothetical protein
LDREKGRKREKAQKACSQLPELARGKPGMKIEKHNAYGCGIREEAKEEAHEKVSSPLRFNPSGHQPQHFR